MYDTSVKSGNTFKVFEAHQESAAKWCVLDAHKSDENHTWLLDFVVSANEQVESYHAVSLPIREQLMWNVLLWLELEIKVLRKKHMIASEMLLLVIYVKTAKQRTTMREALSKLRDTFLSFNACTPRLCAKAGEDCRQKTSCGGATSEDDNVLAVLNYLPRFLKTKQENHCQSRRG